MPGAYASIPSSLCFIDWAIRCKENDTYQEYIDDTECRAGGKTWIDKHIKKLEGQLRYVQRKPKALKSRGASEIEEIKASLSDQIEASIDVKQECSNKINRDDKGSFNGGLEPRAERNRNAKFSVVQSQLRRR